MTHSSLTCTTCPAYNASGLKRLGLNAATADYVIALAGNPNTGKSTVFNALTGLRQHVGNWPGKTVARAEGAYSFNGHTYRLVDLPGTYSLLSTSMDEQIARDFILFGQPTVTLVVVDATRLERNLNLTLQILEITSQVVIGLNLMDEAARNGIQIDARHLSRELGVPVVPMAARRNEGVPALLDAVDQVATGKYVTRPRRLPQISPSLEKALGEIEAEVLRLYPNLQNARWVALRLLDGDASIEAALQDGTLGELTRPEHAANLISLTSQASGRGTLEKAS